MIRIVPPMRNDDQGQGHFGASRGSRQHHGIDFACLPGSEILSPVIGIVTKLGYPYGEGEGHPGDSDPYRYVEITRLRHRHRLFYIDPIVDIGQQISIDQPIGIVQDLTRRYPGMTTHCHYEIMDGDDYLDPGVTA